MERFNSFEAFAVYCEAENKKEKEEYERKMLTMEHVCKNCRHCFGRHFDPDPPNFPESSDVFCMQRTCQNDGCK